MATSLLSRDGKTHSEYRAKRVILEIYDELAAAIATGRPYQTRLDPPPPIPAPPTQRVPRSQRHDR